MSEDERKLVITDDLLEQVLRNQLVLMCGLVHRSGCQEIADTEALLERLKELENLHL